MAPAMKIKLVRSGDGSVEPGANAPPANVPPPAAATPPAAPGAPAPVPGGYAPAAPQVGMQSFMAYPVQGVPGQPQAMVIQQGVPIAGAVVYQPVNMAAGQQSIIGYTLTPQVAPAPAPAAAAPPLAPAATPPPAAPPALIPPNPALKTSRGMPQPLPAVAPVAPVVPDAPTPSGSRASTVTRTKSPAAPMGFKKVEVQQAPAAANAPELKKAERQSKAARDLLVRMGVATLLLVIGQVMGSFLPLLRVWAKTEVPPAAPLAANAAFLVLVAGCLLWRTKGTAVIAGGLIFLSALSMFLLVPLGSALPGLGIPQLSDLLPTTGEAAGAFCFLMASFGLATSDATGRWALAGVLGVTGLVVPWTPLQSYMPDLSGMFASSSPAAATGSSGSGAVTDAGGSGNAPPMTPAGTASGTIVVSGGSTAPIATTTSTTADFSIQLPTGWTEVSTGEPGLLLAATSNTRDITLRVSKEPLPAQSNFDAYADAKLVQTRALTGQASGMIVGVPGRKDRKRLFVMGEKQVAEQLLVIKQGTCFSVLCQGERSAIQEHRSELDRIFQAFEPR